ncbi:MAG: T9SS type A sorting domain-containing protein, partial [Bacteroidales bacterium]|nr:T9SS type A sorting domain-containing protein [Bacteroidales bacterium]
DNSGPEEYANERDCHKLIQPAGAANITLTFTSFSTEENYDFVTVYDGATTSAPELGRFSGSSLPPVITSSGGSMMVRFTSDGSVTAQGWEALYESSQSYEIISEKSSRADKIKRYPNYDNIIFSLYPNPTKGKIKLICDELTDEDLIIEIINPEGKISRLMQIENYNGFTEIDFSDFTVGVYYVKIYNNDFVKLHKVIYSE